MAKRKKIVRTSLKPASRKARPASSRKVALWENKLSVHRKEARKKTQRIQAKLEEARNGG